MEKVKKPWYTGKALYLIVPIVSCLILLSFYISIVYGVYKVPAASMEDTLHIGDHFFADEFAYIDSSPERNDLVVFYSPHDNKKYVKRCIALPGDTIFIKDKVVLINGIERTEPETVKFITKQIKQRNPGGRNSLDNYGPFVIPEGRYFMMGDNRDNSYDSRSWGTVPEENIIGKVSAIYWSDNWNRIGMTPN